MDYQNNVIEGDREFAKQFENYVNGSMQSADATGREMAKAHRYLQQEMFKVCFAYIRQLARDYQAGNYDDRNDWATRLSAMAYGHLIEMGEVYDPEYRKVTITF